MHRSPHGLIAIIACAAALAACSASISGTVTRNAIVPSSIGSLTRPDANRPVVVAMNSATGRLETWPMRRGGGGDPTPISGKLGLDNVDALAAVGDVVMIAAQRPPSISLYNMKTHALKILADPFGTPLDLAVGRDGTIYAIDLNGFPSPVTMYKPPAYKPRELLCNAVHRAVRIAVDDESDIFVDGYGIKSSGIIAEIPNGPNGPDPRHCVRLPLKSGAGYVEGVTVDPKTDDLLTLDNPDSCAGGREGRLTTYPKPYDKTTGRSRMIGVVCPVGLRLNADSTVVFTIDTTIGNGLQFILQRSYPDGGDFGNYHGGSPAAFTTIPNTLPN